MKTMKDLCLYFSQVNASISYSHLITSTMSLCKRQYYRVNTEWQRPLSGVHSIMKEKLAQAGVWGEGCKPAPFHYVYNHVQSCSVRSAERTDTQYTPQISSLSICPQWAVRPVRYSTSVRHVTGNDKDYLRKIPRVVW